MSYVTVEVDVDIDDVISSASNKDLIDECKHRGIVVGQDLSITDLIVENSNLDKKSVQLIMVSNVELLLSKINNVNHFELEEFLNKY